jgi:hypothetical protein
MNIYNYYYKKKGDMCLATPKLTPCRLEDENILGRYLFSEETSSGL